MKQLQERVLFELIRVEKPNFLGLKIVLKAELVSMAVLNVNAWKQMRQLVPPL